MIRKLLNIANILVSRRLFHWAQTQAEQRSTCQTSREHRCACECDGCAPHFLLNPLGCYNAEPYCASIADSPWWDIYDDSTYCARDRGLRCVGVEWPLLSD